MSLSLACSTFRSSGWVTLPGVWRASTRYRALQTRTRTEEVESYSPYVYPPEDHESSRPSSNTISRHGKLVNGRQSERQSRSAFDGGEEPTSSRSDPFARDLSGSVTLLSPVVKESPPLSERDRARTQSFFLTHDAKFYYGAPNFRLVPRSQYAEVCFLGRSNVGKSSLINALLDTPGLAITSSKPGRTRMINGFVFGPVCGGMEEKGRKSGMRVTKSAARKTTLGRERSEIAQQQELDKAEGRGAAKPAMGARGVVLVDMPGYGYASWKTWGDEIMKFVGRREQLRHTYVLINGLHGIKRTDKELITQLQELDAKFSLVLTKGDTVKGGRNGLLRTAEELRALYEVPVWPTQTVGKLDGLDALRMAILEQTGEAELGSSKGQAAVD